MEIPDRNPVRFDSESCFNVCAAGEVDPLLCPKCGAQMRLIALIEDPAVIERILSWLGLWQPLPASGPSLRPPKRRSQLSLLPNLPKCAKGAQHLP